MTSKFFRYDYMPKYFRSVETADSEITSYFIDDIIVALFQQRIKILIVFLQSQYRKKIKFLKKFSRTFN